MIRLREDPPVDGLVAVQGDFFYADHNAVERCQQFALILKSSSAPSMN